MIRQAELSDAYEIEALIKLGSEVGQVLLRSKIENKNTIKSFLLYTENNKIVGCGSLEVYSQKLAEIRSLVVLPKYQKKGIGSKLIEACILRAKGLGTYQVLAVTDKQKLFETAGFCLKINDKQPLFINLKNYVQATNYL